MTDPAQTAEITRADREDREKQAREVLAATKHSERCELKLDLGYGPRACTCQQVERAMLTFAEQAVLMERERCAAFADHWAEPAAIMLSSAFGLTDDEHRIAKQTAAGIATAIREPSA